MYMDIHESMCKSLNEEIKKVEKELIKLINEDDELQKQFKLITSIDGVGTQTALFMIAFTGGFSLFDNSRKFASYAGVAPFPYCSGTSIRGRTRISSYGHKKFKSLLSNCATTAIRNNSELRLYYERRISEGKSKMSTINIIRNKLLGRIFAVVHRGTPYVDTVAYCG